MVCLQLKRVVVAVLVVAVLVAILLEDKAVAIHSVDSLQHQTPAEEEQGILIQETPLSSSLNSHDPKTNVKEVSVKQHSKAPVD